MHKSRRVDSDLTLLQRMKIGTPGNGSGRFPIVRYYINTVLASWGWKESHVSSATKFLQRGDSSDDLAAMNSGGTGVFSMNGLFWSIAVLVSGILTYAIVTAPALPPST